MAQAAGIFARFLLCRLRLVSHCEGSDEPQSILKQTDSLKKEKAKIQAPIFYENLKNTFQQSSVSTFDGFRLAVQKQANLNTVVTHFYWLGSQATGAPIYQYRVILPFEDKVISVATDLDLNIEGEVKYPLGPVATKTSFVAGEQANSLTVDFDYSDEDSSSQLQIENKTNTAISVSRMQALTPHFSLGGLGRLNLGEDKLETSFGALYDDKTNLVATEWDSGFRALYMRRVNPNRVHLSSELVVDENENKVTVNAEYTLKQSKIHMGIDSNLLVKSSVETAMASGVTLQFSAEMNQTKDHYRFGYGIAMG